MQFMIKLSFSESGKKSAKKGYYTPINPIPFSINMNWSETFPSTIYCRNLSGENFIEFRFDKSNQILFEISMISIQNDSIQNTSSIDVNIGKDKYFASKIIEEESICEDQQNAIIYRTPKSFCIVFGDKKMPDLVYYQIAEDIFLGIDDNFYLRSVLLDNLLRTDLVDIFGS
jgi:hypothetical protein